MKSAILLTIVMLAAAFSACSVNRDAEVKSFVADVDQVAIDIVREVDSKPETGVDRAQQLLDNRKEGLKAKFETFKDLRGYQLSGDLTKRFTEAVTENVSKVTSLQVKYADKSAEDAKFAQKLNKLSDDFNSIFGV
jgi:hypothetical protein